MGDGDTAKIVNLPVASFFRTHSMSQIKDEMNQILQFYHFALTSAVQKRKTKHALLKNKTRLFITCSLKGITFQCVQGVDQFGKLVCKYFSGLGKGDSPFTSFKKGRTHPFFERLYPTTKCGLSHIS